MKVTPSLYFLVSLYQVAFYKSNMQILTFKVLSKLQLFTTVNEKGLRLKSINTLTSVGE